MFLKAEDYYVEPAETLVLKLLNGTFDESLNAINRERMQVVSLVNNGRTTYPPLSAWYDAENTSFLDIKTTSPGTYVVGVSLRQNIITLSAEDFTTYLRHDGILDTLAEFEASGSKTDVTEHYAKHVRVIFLSVDFERDRCPVRSIIGVGILNLFHVDQADVPDSFCRRNKAGPPIFIGAQ